MEQKKILWIIVSVAVFLCVVFVAGLLWFYPSKDVQTASAGSSGASQADIDFDPVEWVRNSADYPGLNTSEEKNNDSPGEFTIVYGETDSNTPGSTGAVNAPSSASESGVSVVQSETPAAKTEPVPAPAKTEARETVSVAAPSRPKRPVAEYWIQAGSFTSRSGAENAKKTLSEENVSSRITIKTINGTDYYRVRIGPYANKQEAEKFLQWVKRLDDFKKSYVSKVTVLR